MSETTQPIPLTDLRIGNYVTHPQNPIIKIRSFTSDIITYYIDEDKYSWTHPDFISGIPLTEEWLEKLGFILKDYEWMWTEDLNLFFSLGYFYVSTEDTDYKVSKRINFIHELQNAFYWITGTELTLK